MPELLQVAIIQTHFIFLKPPDYIKIKCYRVWEPLFLPYFKFKNNTCDNVDKRENPIDRDIDFGMHTGFPSKSWTFLQEIPKSAYIIPLLIIQRLYTICRGASTHPDIVDKTNTGYNRAAVPVPHCMSWGRHV